MTILFVDLDFSYLENSLLLIFHEGLGDMAPLEVLKMGILLMGFPINQIKSLHNNGDLDRKGLCRQSQEQERPV